MTLLYFFQVQLNLYLKTSLNENDFKSVFWDLSPCPGLEKHLGGLHGAQRTGKCFCGSQFPEPPSRCPSATPSQYLLFSPNQVGPQESLAVAPRTRVLGVKSLQHPHTTPSQHSAHSRMLTESRRGPFIPGIPPNTQALS